MPIQCTEEIRPVSETEFHAIDKQVVGLAFQIQNQYGRFLSEELYQTELAERCRVLGIDVAREMKIRVSHDDFVKDYFVDLMVNQCVPFETKAVEELLPIHESQLLNYVFLLSLQHGSLINFRPASVDRRFVSTTLALEDRRAIKVVEEGWRSDLPEFKQLRDRLLALLADWGAFLDFRLYREALTHFHGGEGQVIRRIPVRAASGRTLGTQEVHMLNDEFAFAVSAVKTGQAMMLQHQRRFLVHTDLQGIAWVNLNGRMIEFRSIGRE